MGGCISQTAERTACTKCGMQITNPKANNHQCPILKPIIHMNQQPVTPFPELVQITSKAIPDKNQRIKVKVPKDKQKTKFIWKEQQSIFYPKQLRQIPRQIIKHAKFQQKMTWFRLNMETKRISWQKGSDVLKVDRWNILFSSRQGLQNINLYKELKIEFNDQKVDDAGGLLREWMHLCVKQIMSKQTGIFKQCNTDQTAYKFIWDNNVVEQLAVAALSLLGLIIGKALFERISINCFLDRTILRQICRQPVHLSDVYSYDKELYESWSSMLTMPNIQQLHLDGCVYHTHGENDLEQFQLFPNGKNTMITNKNKQMYITEIINMYCTKSTQNYLDALTNSVYKVIPPEFLSVFEPYELQMMLYGPPTIDVKDWRAHTVYEGFETNDNHIKWFWQCLQIADQNRLKNMLHYCTGSARVPILGFKYLQSNRGQIRQFTLRRVQYESANPFPKSHTCFNRLQLPNYTTRQELQQRVKTIMSEQISHYGLS